MKAKTVALILIALITLLRVWMASQVGLGDAEAYYWAWSRELSPGYYDHGPVVALLIWLGTSLAGHSPLGVRLPFIVLSALTLWLAGQLAARAAGAWTAGLWAVVSLLAMPVFLVAGGAANPDVPFLALVVCFTAVLLGHRSLPWTALAGLLVGLAFCTKYFGLLLMLPLLVAAWGHPRRWRAVPLALGSALAGASPVVLWNVTHQWASVTYHLASRHTRAPGPSLENLGKLVGGQVGYLSPLVLLGLIAAGVYIWRRRDEAQNRVLLLTSAPLLLAGYLLIAVVPSAEPHWPVAGYLPLVIALGTLLPAWTPRSRRVRVLVWMALVFSGVVAIAFHLHLLTDLGLRMMPASYNARYDLSNELRGWPRVADEVCRWVRAPVLGSSGASGALVLAPLRGTPGYGDDAKQRRAGTGIQISRVIVAGCHYTTCSQLRFASRGRFRVICPSPRVDQFDFFEGGDGASRRGVDLLYVRDERFPWDAARLFRCAAVRGLSEVKIRRAGRTVRRFSLQLCSGFGGLRIQRWPPGEER